MILSVILIGFSFLFKPKSAAGCIADEESSSLDYVVIGDSECATGFSPMELWKKYGYVGYNCGVAGQRLQECYYLLEQIFECQSPRVVLLETNMCFQSRSDIRMAQQAVDHVAGNIVSLYEYHDQWKQLLFPNEGETAARNTANVNKGFRTTFQVTAYTGGNYVIPSSDVQEIASAQRGYLDQIVSLCREKGAQLIFYSTPSPINWTYQKHNGLADFADDNNIPFLDLNLAADMEAIDWSQDTFDKGDHLNFRGAAKITQYMGAYLSGTGLLPDHRSDAAYAGWDEKLQAYLVGTKLSS